MIRHRARVEAATIETPELLGELVEQQGQMIEVLNGLAVIAQKAERDGHRRYWQTFSVVVGGLLVGIAALIVALVR